MRQALQAFWARRELRQATVFCVIGGCTIILFWILYFHLRSKVLGWDRLKSVAFDEKILLETCAPHDLGPRLVEQAILAHSRSRFHFELFAHYTAEHFAALSTAFGTSVFAAACVAYLAKRGWANAHEFVVTSFIALSISVAFYGGYPALVKHDSNLADNKRLYLDHQNLLQEIQTFCVSEGDSREFVQLVDAQLRELNHISIEFDPTQIKTWPDQESRSTASAP